MRVERCRSKLPREVEHTPPVKGFKDRLDGLWPTRSHGRCPCLQQGVGCTIFKVLSHPNHSVSRCVKLINLVDKHIFLRTLPLIGLRLSSLLSTSDFPRGIGCDPCYHGSSMYRSSCTLWCSAKYPFDTLCALSISTHASHNRSSCLGSN